MSSTYSKPRDLVLRFTQELDQLLASLADTHPIDDEPVPDVDTFRDNGIVFVVLPAPGAQLKDVHVSLAHGVLTVALHPPDLARATPLPR